MSHRPKRVSFASHTQFVTHVRRSCRVCGATNLQKQGKRRKFWNCPICELDVCEQCVDITIIPVLCVNCSYHEENSASESLDSTQWHPKRCAG